MGDIKSQHTHMFAFYLFYVSVYFTITRVNLNHDRSLEKSTFIMYELFYVIMYKFYKIYKI